MTMPNTPTLTALAADLESGRTNARKLVDECLAKIADKSGEGGRAFVHVEVEAAIEAAKAMDRLREVKAAPSVFAGIPISIKDLFDIKGQVTRAGSRALDDSPPAEVDAPVVSRLRRAGFILIGRTNMTEFAYSGIGINPHYGTPKSVWRREVGHVPGGSSSGAAVSVADGMAHWVRPPGDRAGFRPPITASSVSNRPSSASRAMAVCRCRSRSTVLGRWRAPSSAARCSMWCLPTSRFGRCNR